MREYMSDTEKLTWIEKRFGFTKTVGINPSNDKMEEVEKELLFILNKYKSELGITNPLPRIRIWLTNDKLNFEFFSRKNGHRILLGEWLLNRETPYDR